LNFWELFSQCAQILQHSRSFHGLERVTKTDLLGIYGCSCFVLKLGQYW
jgi:hypothetical protein